MVMTPLYIGNCFAWLHAAQGDRGVVICPAMGVEDLCTHRLIRRMADEISAANLPTLRIDYVGTGDSADANDDAGLVDVWLANIDSAIRYLRDVAGVTEITLVGFRIGALLAAEYAHRHAGVARMVLLGMPNSGHAYLREVRALGMLMAQSEKTGSADEMTDGGLDVAGFCLQPDVCASLCAIEPLKYSHAPVTEVLLSGREPGAPEQRLATHWNSLGANLLCKPMPGYSELNWNSTFADLPPQAFHDVVTFLSLGCSHAVDVNMDRSQATGLHTAQPMLTTHDWQERPVQFGTGGNLFGIVCMPVSSQNASASRHAVLFVNHGANHRIGWARMHVMLARRFSAQGLSSMRMDISGVGDSPARPGYLENQLYARHSQQDVSAAVDWLTAAGHDRITVIGHCSGAHLGFYAVLRDRRIAGLVMLNLQRFFWMRGESLEVATRQVYQASGWYWSAASSPDVWQRVITGKVNVRGIASALFKRLYERISTRSAMLVAAAFGKESPRTKVLRWLRELSGRGVRMLLVYSDEDGGLHELAKYVGNIEKLVRKMPGMKIEIMERADHNLTSAQSRERYALILERFLC
jgi:pimeloyl-ACP methyl ester carboxylesterase